MDTKLNNQVVLSAPGQGQTLPAGMRFRLSSAQTGGALEVIEIEDSPVPLPHVHRSLDECFYIIEGAFTFILGKEEMEAPAGSLVFVPRGTSKTHKHSKGARALFFVMPAGLEGFFRDLGEGIRAGRSEAEVRAELAGKYDSWPAEG